MRPRSWRKSINGLKKSFLSVFYGVLLQGVGKALEAFPIFNATFIADNSIKLHSQAHIAVAIDTPAGLQLPVVLDVAGQTILNIDQELKRLTQKAQNGELGLHDTEGATFTVLTLACLGSLNSARLLIRRSWLPCLSGLFHIVWL